MTTGGETQPVVNSLSRTTGDSGEPRGAHAALGERRDASTLYTPVAAGGRRVSWTWGAVPV